MQRDPHSPPQPAPSDQPDPREPRLVALEERLTFQQHLIDELNAVVLAQQAELERLRREVAGCRRAVDDLSRAGGEDLPHEKPPHY